MENLHASSGEISSTDPRKQFGGTHTAANTTMNTSNVMEFPPVCGNSHRTSSGLDRIEQGLQLDQGHQHAPGLQHEHGDEHVVGFVMVDQQVLHGVGMVQAQACLGLV